MWPGLGLSCYGKAGFWRREGKRKLHESFWENTWKNIFKCMLWLNHDSKLLRTFDHEMNIFCLLWVLEWLQLADARVNGVTQTMTTYLVVPSSKQEEECCFEVYTRKTIELCGVEITYHNEQKPSCFHICHKTTWWLKAPCCTAVKSQIKSINLSLHMCGFVSQRANIWKVIAMIAFPANP